MDELADMKKKLADAEAQLRIISRMLYDSGAPGGPVTQQLKYMLDLLEGPQ